MRISGILAGLSELAQQARREPIGPAGPIASPGQEARPVGVAASPAALRGVLARYDVTDISPRDFSEMIQRLYDAGAINDGQLQELAAVRLDLEQADVAPDESIDLLDFYARRIEKAQHRFGDGNGATRTQLAPLLRRLEWIEKLAVLHDTAGELGMDALV